MVERLVGVRAALEVYCCGAGNSLLQEEDFPEVCTLRDILRDVLPASSLLSVSADVLEKVIRCTKLPWCDMRNRFLLQ